MPTERTRELPRTSVWRNLENMGKKTLATDHVLNYSIYVKCPEEADPDREKID